MIRHIVILQFKNNGRDYLSLMEQTRPLVQAIPGVVSYEIFENQSRYVPKHKCSIGVEIKFLNQAALDVFMAHPNHYAANAMFEQYLEDPPFMALTHKI